MKNTNYVSIYLKKLIKSYCLWSLVFLPIGLDWVHQNLSVAGYLLPFALLYGFVHIGAYYHLWYIPAMILAIFLVNKLLKRFSYKTLFLVAIMLFMFGSVESYYGLLNNGWFKDFFDAFIKIVFTTRSGIFYGMVFTLIGFFLYDYQDRMTASFKNITIVTIVFFILLIIEGNFLYSIDRLDMNFLLMLIPFSFFSFGGLCHFPIPYTSKQKRSVNYLNIIISYIQSVS